MTTVYMTIIFSVYSYSESQK